MRAVFETLGVQDVVAKSIGTSNPHNMIKATFDAFSSMSSPRNVAIKEVEKFLKFLEIQLSQKKPLMQK